MKIEVLCPRPGCGTLTGVSQSGKLSTHKLPDGWRACAASGATQEDAAVFPSPKIGPLGLKE